MLANFSVNSSARDYRAVLLLLFIGSLIALMLPLAKIATANGLSPVSYAFWQALGGAIFLWLWTGRKDPVLLNRKAATYYFWSGLTAVAIPNVIAFLVVARIGSGLTSTFYALPPIATYLIALALGMEQMRLVRLAGIVLAVSGCVRILIPEHSVLAPAQLPWLLLAGLIPVSLAIGNVYRTLAWPEGAKPAQLAPGMLFGAALIVGAVMLARGESGEISMVSSKILGVLLIQSLLTAVTYWAFFELQRRSTPVFLSQIGFVVTLAGLVLGMVIFSESYPWTVWVGVLMLLAGASLSNRKQNSPVK